MDINVLLVGLQSVGLFLMANLIAILFLAGLAVIVFAVFTVSTFWGYVAIGLALILIALILANESKETS